MLVTCCEIYMSIYNFDLLNISGEKEYYEKQFATLKSFEDVDSLALSSNDGIIDEEEERKEQAQHERAMNISNWANVFLLVFKV